MSEIGEHNKVPHQEQRGAIDASLTGSLKNAIFLFLEHPSAGAKLFVVDKFRSNTHQNGRFVSNRETGVGEIRLADVADKGTIQICLGNNIWKVVEMPLAGTGQSVTRDGVWLGSDLWLEEESLSTIREYQRQFQEGHAQNAIDRGRGRGHRGGGSEILQPSTVERVKSPFQTALEKYRLTSERIEPFHTVESVVERVFLSPDDLYFIDIQTSEGQELFSQVWFQTCGLRPPRPFVPPERILKRWVPAERFPDKVDKDEGDFSYLVLLAQSRIVANLLDKGDDNEVARPMFTQTSGYINIMDWPEADPQKKDSWGKPYLESPSASTPLLEKLGITGVVATRREIDEALWEGDPGDRSPSQIHKSVIVDMGLDPTEYRFRLVDYGEYFRLAPRLGWGLETHFDGYGVDVIDKKRYGLCGRSKDYGEVPHANFSNPSKKLAVRLVLVRHWQ